MISDEDVVKQDLGAAEFDKRYAKLDGLDRIQAIHAASVPLWAKNNMTRQLSVDNEIAVPVNKVVHMLVTSNDVIHGWTIPSFGSKVQAVPGRITGTWFRPTQTGMFYGQCSVLCGKAHSGMPIAIRVVNEKAFADWTDALKQAGSERDSGKRRDLINRAKQVLKTAEIEDRAAAVKVAQGLPSASRSN
jgi:cytochrome c oxidase subunit 2